MNNNLVILHKKGLSSRAKIIAVLEAVQSGMSLSLCFSELLSVTDEADRGFTHELLYGTLRQWWALSRIGESLIEREVTDKGVVAALNIGLYQLLYMNTPDYAAINDTVEALKTLDKSYGVGLVNAILRKVQKSPEKFYKKVNKNHSLPNWLAKQLKMDWAACYAELGVSLRTPAPIYLRVNVRKTTLTDYAKALDAAGIGFTLVALGLDDLLTIRLADGVRVVDLPHFYDGYVMVQDASAQLSGYLLEGVLKAKPDARVLDMCCAPGGKTTHLLERFHMKHLTALDSEAARMQRVHENLARLGLPAAGTMLDVVVADGTSWQSDAPFDVILLDAPCTATGVIRRHPDIALLRSESDVAQTVKLQAKILHNAWQQLKVGGSLLYVTCSLLKAENEAQISAFMAAHSDAKVVGFSLNLPHQFRQSVGYQCLPLSSDAADGFYYAMLTKV